MIDKSQAFSNDAPPPYQHALRPTSGPTSTTRSSSPCSKRQPKARSKAATPSRWLPTSIFGLSKTAKQVRGTTQSLLRDLLSQARPDEHEWLSVLSSCAEACSAQGLNFSTVLQDPFVEGHIPVYWAILKRPTVPVKADHTTPPSDPDALVLAILDASLPLTPQGVADARLACMTVSDNALFVRLGQRYEGFSQRLGTDRVLLGGTDVVDSVSVEEQRNGGGAFTVRFSLTQFQLRMRVSKSAKIEFIACGRLWYLVFCVAGASVAPHSHTGHPGEWLVALGLGEHSSPSWVDARLSIIDRAPPSSPPATPDPQSAAHWSTTLRGRPQPPKHPESGKQRPLVTIPIKTDSHQISPTGPTREVVVSLEKFSSGATLQNDALSYVDAEGTLNAQLAVNLRETHELQNCIIC
ncbi:hypothetical protein BJV78DRAFT_1349886 [Lactifluus subvellereus]|nr:hypothetical protein BJV78DRAFT_1351908 [Lactifluus subvellereus]KAI0256158.1 hypothetical protein BJV78DRAFT_1349886 [Lactifluus subvellereus]